LVHSRSILQGLADADPSAPEWRRFLAYRDRGIGRLLATLGGSDEAIAVFNMARSSLRALADAYPADTKLRFNLVSAHLGLGNLFTKLGRREAAMRILREALPVQERVTRETPIIADGLLNLFSITSQIGKLERDAGRPGEAAAAFRRSIAWMGQIPAPGPRHLYSRACYHALLGGLGDLSGSGVSADEGQAERDRALRDLRAAIAAGHRDLRFIRKAPISTRSAIAPTSAT
jgi:tetratricopeptide (TPR) repeat protein